MHSRRLLSLLMVLSLLAGLVVLQPATPTRATGVLVTNDLSADDFWPAVAESPTGSRLVAIWNQGLEVRTSTSTNGGATWSSEIELADFSSPDVNEERIVYDTNGNLHAFWMAGQGTGRTVRYRYVGAGSDPAQLSSWGTGQSACTNCVRPDVAYDRSGRILLSYEREGSTFVRRTSSTGVWESTVRAIGDAGQAQIAVTPDGKVHLAYLGDDKNIYYVRYNSFDSWQQEAAQVMNTEFSNFRPDIAGDANNRAHIVWLQVVGDSRPPHYAEYIPGQGVSAPLQVGAPSQADTPNWVGITADGSSNVYVTWTGFDVDPKGDIFQNARLNGTWGNITDFNARIVTPQGGQARTSKYVLSHNGSVSMVFAEFTGGFFHTSFLQVASDSEAPVITGVNFTSTPGTQRASATVSGNDPSTQGAASGIARIEYSLDGTNFVTATSGGANPISGTPTSISNVAFDVDLANPGVGGSWTSGTRTLSVRLVDARGNVSSVTQDADVVTIPTASVTRFLAEGYTGGTFDEYVTLANPSGSTIYVSITALYAGTSSGVPGTLVTIAPNQRRTVSIDGVVGGGKELSLKLESNATFVAERPMYFTNYPAVAGMAYNKPRVSALANINGGHLGVAASAAAPEWYFAEGYTGAGFEGYFTIQNPFSGTSTIELTYYLTDGTILTRNVTVTGNKRLTVVVHGPDGQGGIGVDRSYSAKVRTTNGVNIIVERVQYFNYTSDFGQGVTRGVTGGFANLGATSPGPVWYFAEGTTRPGFDQYLTLQNPNSQTNLVQITYYVAGQGAPTVKQLTLAANSRTTVAVHNAADPTGAGLGRGSGGAGLDNSTKVESLDSRNLVAERPMYFVYTGASISDIDGGHNVMGATGLVAPNSSVVMAEGFTGTGFEQYLTFQNPNATAITVTITYLKADGTTVAKDLSLPGNQRTTVAVHNSSGAGLGAGQEFSTKVTVPAGAAGSILVERVNYFRYNSVATGGFSAFGVPS